MIQKLQKLKKKKKKANTTNVDKKTDYVAKIIEIDNKIPNNTNLVKKLIMV